MGAARTVTAGFKQPPYRHVPYKHVSVEHPPFTQPGWWLRVLRGLSGVLTGGLVALAVTVGGAQWLVGSFDRPGPGVVTVVGHVAAALGAVVLQVIADHARGRRATQAACAILTIAACVLWFGWWA